MKNEQIDTIIFDIGHVLVKDGHRTSALAQFGLDYGPQQHNAWQDYKLGRCTEIQYWQKSLEGTFLQDRELELAKIVNEKYENCSPEEAYPFVSNACLNISDRHIIKE